MAVERVYNIPLRKKFQQAPKYRRAKKAVNAAREFLQKHMKASNVKIGKHLNLELWRNGIKNPPHHVKVHAVKDDEGIVKAELVGFPIEEEISAKKPGKEKKELKEAVEEQKEKIKKEETEKEENEEQAKKELEVEKQEILKKPDEKKKLKGIEVVRDSEKKHRMIKDKEVYQRKDGSTQ